MSVATAPTVYGIETLQKTIMHGACPRSLVATAPTVYGIETIILSSSSAASTKRCNSTYRLRY